MQGTHDVRKWGYQDANVFLQTAPNIQCAKCQMMKRQPYFCQGNLIFLEETLKNLDKQFFCLVGLKVHFSEKKLILLAEDSFKNAQIGDLGMGMEGGGCICLRQFSGGQRQTIQARIPFITRSTVVHLLFLDFPFFFYNTSCIDQSPSVCFSPSVVCGG